VRDGGSGWEKRREGPVPPPLTLLKGSRGKTFGLDAKRRGREITNETGEAVARETQGQRSVIRGNLKKQSIGNAAPKREKTTSCPRRLGHQTKSQNGRPSEKYPLLADSWDERTFPGMQIVGGADETYRKHPALHLHQNKGTGGGGGKQPNNKTKPRKKKTPAPEKAKKGPKNS